RTTTSPDFDDAVRMYTGKSANPDFFGGIQTSVRYKGFELGAQLAFTCDKYVFDYPYFVIDGDGRYTPRSTHQWNFDNRWTTPGQEALNPKFVWGNTSLSNSRNSSRALYDATHARLRDLSLSYSLPSDIVEKLKIASMKFTLRGTNLFTWVRDKDLHLDPEAGTDGIIDGLIPKPRTITLGINAGF